MPAEPSHLHVRCIGSMCRHNGIGINKPKKTKADVVEYVRVKVLLRGFAHETEPEPEPEPKPLPRACFTLEAMPQQLAIAKGELEAHRRQRTQLKQVIKNCTAAAKGWRAKKNAHGSKPPRLGRCGWQTERARLVMECVGVQEVKEEAELELQMCELGVTAWERAVEKMRAALFELLLRVNGVHIPAWLR